MNQPMRYPEYGILSLDHTEKVDYSGIIEMGGQQVQLYFMHLDPIDENELIDKSKGMLLCARSQYSSLVKAAESSLEPDETLPPVALLIIYDEVFALQFGNSSEYADELWYEASYESDGTMYDFEKVSPNQGDSPDV